MSGYVTDDASLYLHINWPQQNNPALAGAYDQIAADLGLEKFNWRWAKREAAVICRNDPSLSCILIVRTYDHDPIVKFSNEKGLPWRLLRSNYVAIGADQSWLSSLAKQKNKLNSEIRNNSSGFDSFDLYLAREIKLPDVYDNIFLSTLLSDNSLFVKGKIKKSGILISLAKNGKNLSDPIRQKTINDFGLLDFDLIANFKNPENLLQQWENALAKTDSDNSYLWQQYKPFLQNAYKLSASSSLSQADTSGFYLLLAKKNKNTGNKNFLVSNDFVLILPIGNAKDQAIKDLEASLKAAFARIRPQPVSRKLSDGTRITEYLPQADELDFASRKDYQLLYEKNNDFVLAYKIIGNKVLISNDLRLLEQTTAEPASLDYLKINTGLLPQSRLTSYLKKFQQLTITGGQITAN